MKKTKNKGFTLVELVIVIAVIAILAAVLIPTFVNVIADANQSAAVQEGSSLKTEILSLYEGDFTKYCQDFNSRTVAASTSESKTAKGKDDIVVSGMSKYNEKETYPKFEDIVTGINDDIHVTGSSSSDYALIYTTKSGYTVTITTKDVKAEKTKKE